MHKYISDFLKNNTNCVLDGLTRPQQKSVREVIRGLYTQGTTVLRHLSQDERKNTRGQAEKYSRHLQNIEITDTVNDFAVQRLKQHISEDRVIAYDLSDIAKPYAKKMEGLSKVFDGSQRKISPGYFLHGVAIEEGMLHISLHDQDKHFLPQVRKNILLNMKERIGERGIWTFDRGNDSFGLFDLMRKESLRFICRLKKDRQVIIEETGEVKDVGDIETGDYSVLLPKDKSKTLWRLVITHHLDPDTHEPIRLLTNLSSEYSTEVIEKFYLQRWCIEKLYRRTKGKFGLEKVRVLSLSVLKALLALVHFCMVVSDLLYKKLSDIQTFFASGIQLLYQHFLRKRSLKPNQDSFLSFLQHILPAYLARVHPPPIQSPPTLFDPLS